MCVCLCVSHLVVSASLQPYGLQPTRLLCPWDSLGKNTGVGSHFLLQGIFPTQGSHPCLLLGRWILYHLATREAQQLYEVGIFISIVQTRKRRPQQSWDLSMGIELKRHAARDHPQVCLVKTLCFWPKTEYQSNPSTPPHLLHSSPTKSFILKYLKQIKIDNNERTIFASSPA